MTGLSWVYMTAKDQAEAESICHMLVKSRLAACANIFPSVTSIYEWKGETISDTETVFIVKTKTDLVSDLIAAVKSMHSYECPCIVALPIESGSDDYSNWLRQQTGPRML